MDPNYFYNINYHSAGRIEGYEYSKHDPENRVDLTLFYDEAMWNSPLLNDQGRDWITKYQTVPYFNSAVRGLGLEFDCGSALPALFCGLHPLDAASRQLTFDGMSRIMNIAPIAQPIMSSFVTMCEVGIFPSRGSTLFRIYTRGTPTNLKAFADANGAINTDIITSQSRYSPDTFGVSFDWDGVEMTNFTFSSWSLCDDDPWVIEKTTEATAIIDQNYAGLNYRIDCGKKVSLWPGVDPNYLKLYVQVRRPRPLPV